jgi:hypothetical protein
MVDIIATTYASPSFEEKAFGPLHGPWHPQQQQQQQHAAAAVASYFSMELFSAVARLALSSPPPEAVAEECADGPPVCDACQTGDAGWRTTDDCPQCYHATRVSAMLLSASTDTGITAPAKEVISTAEPVAQPQQQQQQTPPPSPPPKEHVYSNPSEEEEDEEEEEEEYEDEDEESLEWLESQFPDPPAAGENPRPCFHLRLFGQCGTNESGHQTRYSHDPREAGTARKALFAHWNALVGRYPAEYGEWCALAAQEHANTPGATSTTATTQKQQATPTPCVYWNDRTGRPRTTTEAMQMAGLYPNASCTRSLCELAGMLSDMLSFLEYLGLRSDRTKKPGGRELCYTRGREVFAFDSSTLYGPKIHGHVKQALEPGAPRDMYGAPCRRAGFTLLELVQKSYEFFVYKNVVRKHLRGPAPFFYGDCIYLCTAATNRAAHAEAARHKGIAMEALGHAEETAYRYSPVTHAVALLPWIYRAAEFTDAVVFALLTGASVESVQARRRMEETAKQHASAH